MAARGTVATILLCALALGCAADTGSTEDDAKLARPDCDGAKCDDTTEAGEYEFVVVGSGAGGGPLAANLARAGHRVLLLEAGDHTGPNLTYDIPAFHPQASEDPDLSWSFMVDHYGSDPAQAARDTKLVYDARGEAQGVFYPRGATVGGSTAVNAMITVTPHDSDWDRIAAITGDASWNAEAMRAHFLDVERNDYLGRFDDGTGHGFDGWLNVELPDATLALRDLKISKLVAAAAFTAGDGLFSDLGELTSLLRRDLNSASAGRDAMEGVFTIPTATNGGRRNGTREHIYRTIEEGYPLELRTRSLVTNVVFADEPAPDGTPRAIGVEYLDGRHYRADRRAAGGEMPEKQRVTVTREVILSAGAFNTPQLLMLSGIGPREELERHGIPVRVELPGVGRNLQDRYEVGVVTEVEDDFRLLGGCSFDVNEFDPCMQEWHEGRGPYSTNGGVVSLVHRSTEAEGNPDLFIFGVGGFFKGYYPGYSRDVSSSKRLFTWVILKAHTRNRAGSVTLRSTDPRDTPLIDFAYFEEGGPEDLEAMVQGVEVVRDVIDKSNDLLLLDSVTEVWPGPEADTRDAIAQWVRDEAWGHHASCTARIGADGDPMAVLDSRFRVRGTTGLRVVDASVFPEIPGFFPVVPVYMVSEKAADVILADIGEPRDVRWESTPNVAIPDASEEGVSDTIEVPAGAGPVSGFSVTVHATHTWRSDLVVSLEHDGVEAALLDREGYDADDVHQTFQLDDFDGMDASGTWRLHIRDRAREDTGTLDSWSLQLASVN